MMRLKNKTTLILIAVSFLFISCNKTDWNESYREKNKAPFGTYIVFNEASTLFNDNKIITLKENIFDYLTYNYLEIEEEDNYYNYICIKASGHKFTSSGVESLLRFVHNGNTAFISLNHFTTDLKEQLDFEITNLDKDKYNPSQLKQLAGSLSLEHKKYAEKNYDFDRNIRKNYISTFNKNKSIVLGTQDVNGKEEPNFIKIYHGKGAVYIHTQPNVFTNYFMINEKYDYAENVLSYLPNRTVLWDPLIRTSKHSSKENENKESIFSFFLKNESLTWFLYVSLFGLLLFMLFNARRKQRPIPIVNGLKNSTVEFTQTIANLYHKENNHKDLVTKKIGYFFEKVRTLYLLETNNLNSDFIERLALKSENKLSNTKYLINTIIALNKKYECSEEELVSLNKMIENFFKIK